MNETVYVRTILLVSATEVLVRLTAIGPLHCRCWVPADQLRNIGLGIGPVDFDDGVEEMSLVPCSLGLPVIPPYCHCKGKVGGLVVSVMDTQTGTRRKGPVPSSTRDCKRWCEGRDSETNIQ